MLPAQRRRVLGLGYSQHEASSGTRPGFLIPTFAPSCSPSPTTVHPLPNRTQILASQEMERGKLGAPRP